MSAIKGRNPDGFDRAVAVDGDGNLGWTMTTKFAGEDLDRDLMKVVHECNFEVLTGTKNAVMGGPGRFYGFLVTTGAGGSDTVAFYDGLTAVNAIVSTLVATAGQSVFFPVGVKCANGLSYVEGGTVVVTAFFKLD